MRFASLGLLFLLGCCPKPQNVSIPPAESGMGLAIAEFNANSKQLAKVRKTLTTLADFDIKQSSAVIDAVEKNDEVKQRALGAEFVKQTYERAQYGLDTTDCKIIWKAVLVSCKTKQDGFELLDVSTPWFDE